MENGEVTIEDGYIKTVEPAGFQTANSVRDGYLVPGFIDLQVNGNDDVDVFWAEQLGWEKLGNALLSQGVTTWCPTVTSAPLKDIYRALERIGQEMERQKKDPTSSSQSGLSKPWIAGAHVEGPFLGKLHGAHNPKWIIPIDIQWLKRILSDMPSVIKVFTLAPELANSMEAISLLNSQGILVSLGHSTATYDQAVQAADAGARMVTHIFNAMTPFHHRSPGLAGAALVDNRLAAGVIADLYHLHQSIINMIFKTKTAEGVALVTDSVAAKAGTLGKVKLLDVTKGSTANAAEDHTQHEPDGNTSPPRLPDSTLAGSCVTMDACIKNVVNLAKIPLTSAIVAASTTPAKLLGLTDRGEITRGKIADLVLLDTSLNVEATWLSGKLAWRRCPQSEMR